MIRTLLRGDAGRGLTTCVPQLRASGAPWTGMGPAKTKLQKPKLGFKWSQTQGLDTMPGLELLQTRCYGDVPW